MEFDELRRTSHSADNFFGEHSFKISMDDADMKLIKDGTAQALQNMENAKKISSYDRRQSTSKTKAPVLNMNLVDWSGFPGAAHQRSPGVGDRKDKKMNNRPSFNLKKIGTEPPANSRPTTTPRSMRRMSADGALNVEKTTPPHSPKSPTGRGKYRNRRHEANASPGPLMPAASDSPAIDRKKRREHLKESLSNARAERQNSGVGRSQRRSASGSRSLSHNRRPQRQIQSTSPSRKAQTRENRSSSPNARLRRPVAAAASSTTLTVSTNGGRRGRQRHNSFHRRKSKERSLSQSEEVFKKATSLRW